MANTTLIQGYRELARTQAGQPDIAGSFFKGLNIEETKAKKEAEIEEINQRVAERMSGLDAGINLNAVEDPKLKSALGSWAISEKRTYADKANEVSKLNDPSDATHMQIVDEMNSINDGFSNVRREMDYVAQLQDNYKNVMQADGGFSADQANKDLFYAMEQIFGGGGEYKTSIKNNHIVYNVNGKEYQAKDLKLPTKKAYAEAKAILDTNVKIRRAGISWNPQIEDLYRTQYDEMFKNEEALRSVLSKDFAKNIPTNDISVDAMGFDAAKEVFIDRVINANRMAAEQGAAEKKSKETPSGTPAAPTGDTAFKYQGVLDDIKRFPGVGKAVKSSGPEYIYDKDTDSIKFKYKDPTTGAVQTVRMTVDQWKDFVTQ